MQKNERNAQSMNYLVARSVAISGQPAYVSGLLLLELGPATIKGMHAQMSALNIIGGKTNHLNKHAQNNSSS